MMIRLRGKVWRLAYYRLKKDWGKCDPPFVKNKKIIINPDTKGEKLLETYIHEMLHGCFWDMDEEAIYESSRDIARALWRLGYRRNE